MSPGKSEISFESLAYIMFMSGMSLKRVADVLGCDIGRVEGALRRRKMVLSYGEETEDG